MTDWYVAPSTITTTGEGTREQPFKCNAINWTLIEPGDTVYLRAVLGNYNETLIIDKSGIPNNYILIQSDPLDGVKAIIDGQNVRLEGITQDTKTYIKIDNIEIKNMIGVNNRAILPGANWKIMNCTILSCFYGIAFSNVPNPYVENCFFSDVSFSINLWNATEAIICKRIQSHNTPEKSGMFSIGGNDTSGLLQLEDIILDGGNANNADNTGLLSIAAGTFSTGSYLKDITIRNSVMKGFFFTNTSGFHVYNLSVNGCMLSGGDIHAGAYNIDFYASDFSYNRDDGVDLKGGCHDINFWGCKANFNGYPVPNDPVNSGDGFSAHDTCYNINQFFCTAIGNRNSGFAHVNTSAGVIYHCTTAFNGSEAGTTNRAGIFINTTADNPTAPAGTKSWKVKNCIGYKDYPRTLWFTAAAIGSTSIDFDYNSYKTLDNSLFATLDGGATNISWATYNGTHEAHSKNEDSKVTTSGMIPYDSPCVDTAPWMVGVNDGGQTDPWGKKVYGLPNIGADQGAGMPVVSRIKAVIGKHIKG